jgi:hypothetical protein
VTGVLFFFSIGAKCESGYLSLYSDWLRAGRPRGQSSCPGRVKNFLHVVQTGSGVHLTYPMGIGCSFFEGRTARA